MTSIFSSATDENPLFVKSNNKHLLYRIQIASIIIALLYPYYFYADFVLLKDVENVTFRYVLNGIHIFSFVMSIAFLCVYRVFKNKDSFMNSFWPAAITSAFPFIYVTLGVVASINSQLLTGNIYAYLIILICVAVLMPIRPRAFLFILLINQSLFLFLLTMVSSDKYTLIAKQINTTATAVIAFFICLTFYKFKKNDFIQHQKLKENEENFRKLFAVSPNPLILTRISDDKIILINDKAIDFFQIPAGRIHETDASLFYNNEDEKLTITQELLNKGSMKNYVNELQVSPEVFKWILVNYELIDFADEPCILAGVTDITELKKAEVELRKYASTDMLTGVINRRHGMELLQKKLLQAKQRADRFVVCFVDINNLKQVNDQFGHADGDELIKSVCQTLKNNLSPDDLMFRFGGDEFIVVFHRPMSEAVEIWRQIEHNFEKINRSGLKPYTVSVSHGFFQYEPGSEISLEQLIELADKEMYANKAAFRRKK